MHSTGAGSRVVVIDVDELDQRIEAAVRRAIESRPTEGPAEWLDARGAAELLGVSSRQVAKLAASGALPHTRVGKLLRFRRNALIDYLERGTKRAG